VVLPEPMLARPDSLPRGDYSFEVKWDGFRALVATEDGLQVRSRRAWSMADRVPVLRRLPQGLVLDGELLAFALDGRPSFPLLSLRVLHGRDAIPVTLMVFDVLRVEGADAMCLPYAERRALLEALDLNGPAWRTPDVFETGRRCSRRHVLTGSRASWRSAARSGTGPASAAGSRRSTAATGGSARRSNRRGGGGGSG
jgi:ATP-dependent DNA ligase